MLKHINFSRGELEAEKFPPLNKKRNRDRANERFFEDSDERASGYELHDGPAMATVKPPPGTARNECEVLMTGTARNECEVLMTGTARNECEVLMTGTARRNECEVLMTGNSPQRMRSPHDRNRMRSPNDRNIPQAMRRNRNRA